MNFNNICKTHHVNGYNCGVLIIPSFSTATLSFTSEAAYENIILVSKFSNGDVIHEANNKRPNGLQKITIKNCSSVPKYYLITSFHRVSMNTNFIENNIKSNVINEKNYSYNFEDGTDNDFNDITVTIKLQAIN
ncbi:hypothetical protein NNC19_07475 [Clostridium sp. SHJSY1]|uniref:hypothetical protein n=1 Tax=Clostridium sp. SHJSY1 TaxID=2942483 RepID=UPI002874D93F|nr:hypothetical protein [Clostridium sp. SHJSY1]MDS0525515.1 hypothetical protein [Clostridium sp. SHJSY1]